MILKCIALLWTLHLTKTLRFETEYIKENIEQGKKKYQEYKEASRSEKTGSCWGSAILVGVSSGIRLFLFVFISLGPQS